MYIHVDVYMYEKTWGFWWRSNQISVYTYIYEKSHVIWGIQWRRHVHETLIGVDLEGVREEKQQR